MGKFSKVSIIFFLFLAGAASPNYLIWLNVAAISARLGYQAVFLGVACLVGLVVLGLSYRSSGPYCVSNVPQVLIVYLTAVCGIELLGGIGIGWNPAILLGTAVTISLSAPLAPALFGLVCILAYYLVFSFNQTYFFLPLAPAINAPTSLENIVFPLVYIAAFNLFIMLANYFRISRMPAIFSGNFGIQGRAELEKSIDQQVITDTGAVDGDQIHQELLTREYLAQEEINSRNSMQSILDPVVYFMSKNFKAFSAMGFIASQDGEEFHLNASVTKSGRLKKDVVIRPGKHILGMAVRKNSGFVSGEVKSYPAKIEYYEQPEDINSILAMPILDEETGRIDGLLVVDSDRFRAFNDEHKELLCRFTQIAAAMICNARMTSQIHNNAKWVDTLYKATRSLNKILDVEKIMKMMGETLAVSFPNDRVVTCFYNQQSRKGYIWDIIGEEGGLTRGTEFKLNNKNSIYARAFLKREEIIIHDFRKETHTVRFNSPDKTSQKPEELLVVPLLDGRGAVFAVVGLESQTSGAYSNKEMMMISTLKSNFSHSVDKARMVNKLEKLATIDGLTGIPNHRKFQEALSNELFRSKRYREQFSLLLIDIDHFKKFNDTYGHPVGDIVLKSVAKKILQTIRMNDMVARYGGEEFAAIVINTSEQESILMANRICNAVESMKIENAGKILKVTISIGVATFPHDVQTKQELIDAADKALYYSKENGRNCATQFSRMNLK